MSVYGTYWFGTREGLLVLYCLSSCPSDELQENDWDRSQAVASELTTLLNNTRDTECKRNHVIGFQVLTITLFWKVVLGPLLSTHKWQARNSQHHITFVFFNEMLSFVLHLICLGELKNGAKYHFCMRISTGDMSKVISSQGLTGPQRNALKHPGRGWQRRPYLLEYNRHRNSFWQVG